jgi:hypothetical protein
LAASPRLPQIRLARLFSFTMIPDSTRMAEREPESQKHHAPLTGVVCGIEPKRLTT